MIIPSSARSFRIINWNIERRSPTSWQGKSLAQEIESLHPNLVCLTEGWESSTEQWSGYSISAPGVAWSEQSEQERKVVLWSHNPWRNAERIDQLEKIGSAVTGITILGSTDVRVLGVCIPYHFASPLGQEPKAKMWSQHEAFLSKLRPHLKPWLEERPLIVVGDYNRRIPRAWGPRVSYELLVDTFANLKIATSGVLDGVNAQSIDHIALSRHFNVERVIGLPA